MASTRWICPHCEHACVITYEANIRSGVVFSNMNSVDGSIGVEAQFVACPNPACTKVTLYLNYGKGELATVKAMRWFEPPQKRQLLPPTYARPTPDYVPAPIRADYEEACAIADLSPKASAALSRRALQGIVRDFHGIVENTLNLELEALKGVVDPVTWKAIDAVRSVGNIGAHMEKDINVIVDVEPDEAIRLIRLIEMLIREWYVARYNRSEELNALVAIGKEKQEQRKGPIASFPEEAAASNAAGHSD
jgi:hypothetical protein